jgi:hypothetical protein
MRFPCASPLAENRCFGGYRTQTATIVLCAPERLFPRMGAGA